MKNIISLVFTILIAAGMIVVGWISGFELAENQLETLKIVGIVCLASIAYCFIVGEISRNNSQMDKLWSILPIAYTWIVVFMSNFNFRTIIIAVVATLWGVRLTYNFAKKGAYKLKFWEGEEDYRWKILRAKKPLSNKFVWALFDLFFISLFQNVVVCGMTLPSIVVMNSEASFGVVDLVASIFAVSFLVYEVIADHQQNKFQVKKYEMLNSGKKLNELPEPYSRGFNVTGLWKYSRHPNYLGEQGIWVSVYLFVLATEAAKWGVFNWSITGCMLLILVFAGSSRMSEAISCKKYVEFPTYQKQVFKYLPFKGYKGIEKEN